MTDAVGGIRGPAMDEVRLSGKSGAGPGQGSVDFSKIFETAVTRVDQFQKDAEQQVDRLLRGEDQELHQVVLAGQRAELAFDYFLQVRNKVVSAYQEIMRMQM